ncbi:MAG TPA: amidohydrolase family protein [Clostridia bacterium]|nr:amidohydrolase family protein [Clostridia bacterium]
MKDAVIPKCSAVKLITRNPARIMGLSYKGEIKIGCYADIVIFEDDVNIKRCYSSGRSG